LAVAAMLLLGLCALVDVLSLAPEWYDYQLLQRAGNDAEVSEQEKDVADVMVGAFAIAHLACFVATAVVFCMWMYRAHKNLRSLNVRGLTYSPGWAAGAFFVPILNLFRPYQIAQEIYKASDPDAPLDDRYAWRRRSGSSLIGAWWAFWIIGNIISQFAFRMSFHDDNATMQLTAAALQMISDVLTVPTALFAVLVIHQIRSRQLRRHQLLQEK
jgi:hypothetical protein